MGPLEAMVFLDASCYFWTRRGISARVHNERAAGRAGGRGKDGKTISGHVFGRAAGGQAAKVISGHVFSKIISGHVSGRAGGRAGGQALQQNYFWARLRAGGRADRLAKLFLDASSIFLDTSSLFLGT